MGVENNKVEKTQFTKLKLLELKKVLRFEVMNYGNKENMFMKPQVKKELMRMPMLTCDPCKMRFNSESEYIIHVKIVHMMLAIKPEPVYDHKPETIPDKPEHVLDRLPEPISNLSQFQVFGANNIP